MSCTCSGQTPTILRSEHLNVSHPQQHGHNRPILSTTCRPANWFRKIQIPIFIAASNGYKFLVGENEPVLRPVLPHVVIDLGEGLSKLPAGIGVFRV